MPEPILFLKAMAWSGLVSWLIVSLGGLPWRSPNPRRIAAAWAIGVASGFYAGCRMLDVGVSWPPREDQDRLLLVILPLTLMGELAATLPGRARHIAWLFRAIVAATTARILLHGSSYLTDHSGSGSSEWTEDEAVLILGVMGTVLAGFWAAMGGLAGGEQGRSVPVVLALANLAAGIVVMLSGYASGGQLGLPLAAALGGSAIASLAMSTPRLPFGSVGLGVVGLFSLLTVGRFFGSLSTLNAVLIFLGPVLVWLLEIPSRFRWAARIALGGLPLALALGLAAQNFLRETTPKPPAVETPALSTVPEPTLEDYLNFRK